MIVKFVRNNKKQKVGVIVALDKEKIGWSKCNKEDSFNKEFGKIIATVRAKDGCASQIPSAIVKEFNSMKIRAQKYFKKGNKI